MRCAQKACSPALAARAFSDTPEKDLELQYDHRYSCGETLQENDAKETTKTTGWPVILLNNTSSSHPQSKRTDRLPPSSTLFTGGEPRSTNTSGSKRHARQRSTYRDGPIQAVEQEIRRANSKLATQRAEEEEETNRRRRDGLSGTRPWQTSASTPRKTSSRAEPSCQLTLGQALTPPSRHCIGQHLREMRLHQR